ncbi:hypothetical protein MRX96_028975 [Rhipicephalus microplus]
MSSELLFSAFVLASALLVVLTCASFPGAEEGFFVFTVEDGASLGADIRFVLLGDIIGLIGFRYLSLRRAALVKWLPPQMRQRAGTEFSPHAITVGSHTGQKPVAPQQAPTSRPGVTQVVSASPSPRTSGAPRLIQPKQPQILPKLSSGSANMTTPSAAATTRSQSPRAAQHKATPRPAPVPAPQPATTVQRGAAMGLNTGESAAHREPRDSAAGPRALWDRYRGVQLALRPPHATGLTLGPQTGPRPHGGHPGPPGNPTLVIPQNLGPRPNIFLALPRMMSPPSFAIVPGQPLTLQQLQAMLPTQTMLAQPTLAEIIIKQILESAGELSKCLLAFPEGEKAAFVLLRCELQLMQDEIVNLLV